MQNAITVYAPQDIAPAHELTAALFTEFVQYIDRGEATTRTYIINLRQFAAWMKFAAIVRPVRQDIINYREWLTAEHEAITLDPDTPAGWSYRTDGSNRPVKVICKPNTVKAYLRSVCQFFAWTAASGYYPNIAANIHAPKVDNAQHKKDHFTPAQVLTIENSIAQKAQEATTAAGEQRKDTAGRVQRSTEQGARLMAMYQLAVNCGLRTIELSRANVRDIRVTDGNAVMYIWGKGHSEPDQKKPLAPEVYAAVKEYLTTRTDRPTGNSPLFVSTGNRSKGQRIDPTTISKMLKEAMRNAGFDSDRLTAHSLRHSTGTAVQSLTGDLMQTQKYMRHSNPMTTEIYIHEGEAESIKAAGLAQQLYNLYHGTQATDPRSRLEQSIAKLTPAQIEQLTTIAAAMAH
jgi:integrase/recombinase XerD